MRSSWQKQDSSGFSTPAPDVVERLAKKPAQETERTAIRIPMEPFAPLRRIHLLGRGVNLPLLGIINS